MLYVHLPIIVKVFLLKRHPDLCQINIKNLVSHPLLANKRHKFLLANSNECQLNCLPQRSDHTSNLLDHRIRVNYHCGLHQHFSKRFHNLHNTTISFTHHHLAFYTECQNSLFTHILSSGTESGPSHKVMNHLIIVNKPIRISRS